MLSHSNDRNQAKYAAVRLEIRFALVMYGAGFILLLSMPRDLATNVARHFLERRNQRTLAPSYVGAGYVCNARRLLERYKSSETEIEHAKILIATQQSRAAADKLREAVKYTDEHGLDDDKALSTILSVSARLRQTHPVTNRYCGTGRRSTILGTSPIFFRVSFGHLVGCSGRGATASLT